MDVLVRLDATYQARGPPVHLWVFHCQERHLGATNLAVQRRIPHELGAPVWVAVQP
jgi:hypothetical protein